jgi:hypothetical protein
METIRKAESQRITTKQNINNFRYDSISAETGFYFFLIEYILEDSCSDIYMVKFDGGFNGDH